eukprot:4648014-Pyramimonas_sp.AAC.1
MGPGLGEKSKLPDSSRATPVTTWMTVGVIKWIGGLQVDAKVGYIWPNLAYKWVTSALSSLWGVNDPG